MDLETKWAEGRKKWGWIAVFTMLAVFGFVADRQVRLADEREAQANLKRQDDSFQQILRGVTGGDFYAFVDLANRSPVNGEYPLIVELTGRMMGVFLEITKPGDATFAPIRRHIPPNLTPDKIGLMETLAPGDYRVTFLSLNGAWEQRLSIPAENALAGRKITIIRDGKEFTPQ